ncbi:MAG: hypothetical protein KME22_25355 [Hassallia sp. WJT32-NPBG1]|jgi:hypothetical protein|nr:hypothetical protein [Hassallia sp. WJT32-NPBG1]
MHPSLLYDVNNRVRIKDTQVQRRFPDSSVFLETSDALRQDAQHQSNNLFSDAMGTHKGKKNEQPSPKGDAARKQNRAGREILVYREYFFPALPWR